MNTGELEKIISEWINKRDDVHQVIIFTLDGLPVIAACKKADGESITEKLSAMGATIISLVETFIKEATGEEDTVITTFSTKNSKITIGQLTDKHGMIIIERR